MSLRCGTLAGRVLLNALKNFTGHTKGFFSNSSSLLAQGREYFGNTGEPYTLTALGVRIYILTRSIDIVEAYRNTSTLSFDIFVQGLMRSTGSSEVVIQKMYQRMSPHEDGFPNPRNKPLANLSHDLHRHQLYPGKNLDNLGDGFAAYFTKHLSLEKLLKERNYCVGSLSEKSIVVPLSTWTSDFIIRAGQNAYFGQKLADIDPRLSWTFIEYDELSWQVLYRYPPFLSRKMHQRRDEVTSAIEKYFAVPPEQRTGDAWFVKAMEAEMRQLGMSTQELAPMMAVIYWAINTNTRRACFWMLAQICHRPELIRSLREETKSAFANDCSTPDIAILTRCPYLNAVWLETLRLAAFSASVRYVNQDTEINGFTLRKDSRIVIPYRQLHFNEEVFGDPVNDFVPDRFLTNPKLDKSSTWRPFGGGETMCPGRHIAKHAVMLFVATVLYRFDIELAYPQRFPRTDDGKPVVGMVSAVEGDDVMVRLTARLNM